MHRLLLLINWNKYHVIFVEGVLEVFEAENAVN